MFATSQFLSNAVSLNLGISIDPNSVSLKIFKQNTVALPRPLSQPFMERRVAGRRHLSILLDATPKTMRVCDDDKEELSSGLNGMHWAPFDSCQSCHPAATIAGRQ